MAELLASICRKTGDETGEKLWLIRTAEAIDQQLTGDSSEQADSYHGAAEAMGRLGDLGRAAAMAEKCIECIRKSIADLKPDHTLFEYANMRCTLSSALAMLGDWKKDVTTLTEGLEVASSTIALLGLPNAENIHIWGPLNHNQGQCMFRIGELSGNISLVNEALDFLVNSVSHKRLHKQDASADETEELIARVRDAAARLNDAQIH